MNSLDHQAKQITYNVYNYYKTRKHDPDNAEIKRSINLIDTVSATTGLSKSSVTRIIQEGNKMKLENGEVKFKPIKRKKKSRQKRIEITEYMEGVIRKKVIEFYTKKKEVPSVRSLNMLLKRENILHCSNEYLRKLLHKLGFTNAEDESPGMLRERADIVTERLKYLKDIKDCKVKGKTIFYFNDTKRWDHTKGIQITEMPSFIIVHAGNGAEFLNGSFIMMKDKPESDGNESLEQSEDFDWLKDVFLRELPSSAVIVMNYEYCASVEAAAVRDKKPSLYATRAEMTEWLTRHNIPFKETYLKTDLCNLIHKSESKPEVKLVRILKENGHEILYLPKSHHDLNPVTIAWEKLKESALNNAAKMLFAKYSKEQWESCFAEVINNENDYYNHDMKVNDAEHISQLTVKEEVRSDSDETDDSDS